MDRSHASQQWGFLPKLITGPAINHNVTTRLQFGANMACQFDARSTSILPTCAMFTVTFLQTLASLSDIQNILPRHPRINLCVILADEFGYGNLIGNVVILIQHQPPRNFEIIAY